MAENMLVRLKPYNKKKGHILRRYTYRGLRFQGSRGWYRVKKDVADYLATVYQVAGDEDSPAAFDVCTEKEAKAIDKREAHHARGAMPVEDAKDATDPPPEPNSNPVTDSQAGGDLTTADLPTSKPSGRRKKRSSRK